MTNFVDTLRYHRRGEVLTEIDKKMAEVIEAVRATGRAGSITVTLDIKPLSADDRTALTVSDKVAGKVPKPASKASVFYANNENRLQRQDPRQMEFEAIRKVETLPEADSLEVALGKS